MSSNRDGNGAVQVRFQAMKDYMKEVLAALDVASNGSLPTPVEPGHSLVLHLGFDSMKMSLLSLALETELGCAIVLDEWIGSHSDPNELTVDSLCRYLQQTVAGDERRVASQ
jgi:acyl carrier protein